VVLFTGEYRPALDEKGRLAIPVKLRKKRGLSGPPSGSSALTDSFLEWVFTYGYDRCIMGMPLETWETFVNDKISSMAKSVKENRKRVRFLLSGAFECELDKQGRFIVPLNLKDYALIKKDVVVIGVGEFLEIWDKDNYDKEMKMDPGSLDDFASQFWS
jgi:MraZ protein